jgi:lysophospholipase L1-like esterase
MTAYATSHALALIARFAVLTALAPSPAAAQVAQFNPPKLYYLALGDSITYGYQQSKVQGGVLDASSFTTGYVDVFAFLLREI